MARKCSVERANAKTGGFAIAKKNITIQYQNTDHSEQDILNRIKENIIANGMSDDDILELNIYIKPEEHAVYYVVNNEINGQIGF